MRRNVRRASWALSVALIASGVSIRAELRPGDLVALSRVSESERFHSVLRIDPFSGEIEVIFDTEEIGRTSDIVIHSQSEISLLQRSVPGSDGKIFTVDLDTGDYEVNELGFHALSNFTLAHHGDFLVSGQLPLPTPLGDPRTTAAIMRVGRETGEETVLSGAGAMFPTSLSVDICNDVVVGIGAGFLTGCGKSLSAGADQAI